MKWSDNYKYTTDLSDVYLSKLTEREKNTQRITIPADKLRFVSTTKALEKYKTDKALAEKIGVMEDIVTETNGKTGLIVTVSGTPYLLGDSSWISISGRISIYGNGLWALEPIDKANLFNARLLQLKDTPVMVIIVDDKVRAIMSGKYSVIPANMVVEKIIEKAQERFAETMFSGGMFTHEITVTTIAFPEVAKKIGETYGIDGLVPGIKIITSDTGYAGIKIVGFWMANKEKGFQQAGSEIYLRHENTNKLDKVLEEMPNLFLKYQNMAAKLAELLNVEMKYPIQAIKNACEKLKLGKKHAKFIAENLPTGDISAYDICMEIFTLPHRLNLSDMSRLEMEEVVARAINLNYKDLDMKTNP